MSFANRGHRCQPNTLCFECFRAGRRQAGQSADAGVHRRKGDGAQSLPPWPADRERRISHQQTMLEHLLQLRRTTVCPISRTPSRSGS